MLRRYAHLRILTATWRQRESPGPWLPEALRFAGWARSVVSALAGSGGAVSVFQFR